MVRAAAALRAADLAIVCYRAIDTTIAIRFLRGVAQGRTALLAAGAITGAVFAGLVERGTGLTGLVARGVAAVDLNALMVARTAVSRVTVSAGRAAIVGAAFPSRT